MRVIKVDSTGHKEVSFTEDELEDFVKKVLVNATKSPEYRGLLREMLFEIVALDAGKSMLGGLKWLLGVLLLGFCFWLSQNGFLEWLKSKGLS